MPFDFGSVVLVRFPFTDQNAWKQRPAIVVSSQHYNDSKPDVIIIAVTSRLRAEVRLGEVLIANWQAAGLLKASALKPLLATIEQSLVLRTLGILADEDKQAMRETLHNILG